MAAYQAGNEAAFRELFERYAGSVYGFLVRRLGDRAAAEDVYQEAFLRLHRARHTYDAGRPFRAWLFGIVHNLLTDTLRGRRRTVATASLEASAHDREDPSGAEATRSLGDIPSEDPSPERLVAAREESEVLGRALSTLPSDEASVLILARIEGLSYDEIGTIVGRSPAATKQLAYRALKRVRAMVTASLREDRP